MEFIYVQGLIYYAERGFFKCTGCKKGLVIQNGGNFEQLRSQNELTYPFSPYCTTGTFCITENTQFYFPLCAYNYLLSNHLSPNRHIILVYRVDLFTIQTSSPNRHITNGLSSGARVSGARDGQEICGNAARTLTAALEQASRRQYRPIQKHHGNQ